LGQEILDRLTGYKNRQVVINCYDEEETLCERDGFHFDRIQVDGERLIFLKDGEIKYCLVFSEFSSSKVLSDFSDYYSFMNERFTVKIYFPH
jgi:hypothetical protein